MAKKIIIYTDGSGNNKTYVGGWGAVIHIGKTTVEVSGSTVNTTTNRMEMYAAICALSIIKTPSDITLYTDSQYLRRGASEYVWRWAENKFKKAKLRGIKNLDLWRKIYKLNKRHEITWEWVRGHNGNKGNERADKLAGHAFRKLRDKLEKKK